MNKPNYGNWIPTPLLRTLGGVSAGLGGLWLASWFLLKDRVISAAALILFLAGLAMTAYMTVCHRAFSFEGKNVMGRIHRFLLTKLPWDGHGRLLDIGCGSGAVSILCAKTWPDADITGIDYWGKGWNYAKEQCEQNAALEGAGHIHFLRGDAAELPFQTGEFDAAVSNFVFHEVKSQPDKRLVVREALRVIRPGGYFAFHDLFEHREIYSDMEEFVTQLKEEGITEIHYEAHTERLGFFPWYCKAPWLLSGLGVLYGRR